MVTNFVRIIIKNNIRIYLSDLSDIVNQVFSYHNYKPLPNLIIANAICAFSPLIYLYDSEKIMIRIKSNGAIKSLIFESNKSKVRILVSNPNIETEYDNSFFNRIPLILGIGDDGLFELSREVNGQIYRSDVKLAKSDIITDLAYFMNKSDQIYSAIKTDVRLDESNSNRVLTSKSIIFQLLPNHTDEDKEWIEQFIKKYDFSNYPVLEYENLIDGELLEIRQVYSDCWCNKEKIINAINLLSQKEIDDIFKNDNTVESKCEFCNQKFYINKNEVK